MELPKIQFKATKPQMLLASHLYQSWMTPTYESDWLVESSLVDDVFGTTSEYWDKCYVDASCYHCIEFQNWLQHMIRLITPF